MSATTQNSHTGPSPDLEAEHARAYRTQKRVCDEATGVLRSLLKAAKADGINTKSMIAAVNCTKLEPEVAIKDLRDQIHWMLMFNMPMTQAELFATSDIEISSKTKALDDEWDAGDRGYHAGRGGQSIDECPYPGGSPLHVAWRTNWSKGQAAIARELGENVEQASGERARPKRGEAQADMPLAADPPAKAARKPRADKGVNGKAKSSAESRASVN
jgi:hypothetical protein